MRAKFIVIGVYGLLMTAALALLLGFPSPGEYAYLSAYGLLSVLLLTLPWSLLLFVFDWQLIHDSRAPGFVLFFLAFAIANALLIWLVIDLVIKKQSVGPK